MADERPAAYHGTGWRPRTGTHAEDVCGGRLWRPVGSDSEWAPLRTVLLAAPPVGWPPPADWNAVLYLEPVDFGRLRDQIVAYAETLDALGVEVLIDDAVTGTGEPSYNGIFVRDQFFMTPEGAVVARMGSEPRAAEARAITVALGRRGMPILHTVRGEAVFEGADALWLHPGLVAIGVGNRTDDAGAAQVASVLAAQGVDVHVVPLPNRVQHLMGLVQLVAADLALVRTELAPPRLLGALADCDVSVVPVAESREIAPGQAMNVVTVGARRVVVPDGTPDFHTHLRSHGIDIAAVVPCPELLKCAGGLACATGIVYRGTAATHSAATRMEPT